MSNNDAVEENLMGRPIVILRSDILSGIEFRRGVSIFSSPITIAVLFKFFESLLLILFMISPIYFAWPTFFAVPITLIFFFSE